MKKYAIWIVLGILVLWGISAYNGLVSSRESVNKSWANVENQYQRRADLIPNLVNVVKGAADFEKSTLEAVIQARASATSIKLDANDLTPEKLQQYQAAQAQLGGALSRLLAVAENYPQLKAIQNFQELQAQLEGTENRINEARRQYNEAAQSYNTSRLKFPRVLIANLLGFKDRPYFESDKGSEKAPEVKF
ncbi:MAG: LemA family protein [Bacteroidetes bacterium]|nr:MAG: LemA family protein [Bacteroidota bacterium]